MTDIAPLISSAARSARELNRMLVAELRALRAVRACGSHVDPHAWSDHDHAIQQLLAGRDDCMQVARGLRRLASHLVTPA